MTAVLATGSVLLSLAVVVTALAAAGAAARTWCRAHRTPPVAATAVAVSAAAVGAAGILAVGGWAGLTRPLPGHPLSGLGLTGEGLRTAPFGLLLGVGEFAALCFLVTVLADAAPLLTWLRRPSSARRAGTPATVGRPGRRPTAVVPHTANNAVGSNWLLLTRSVWALRWPILQAAGAFPVGAVLLALQVVGEEVLLRGALWGAVRTAGVVAVPICATVAVVTVCRLPGLRFDLPTVTSVGFVSVVHTLLFAQGIGILPLAVAQATILVLAGR